MSCRRYPEYKDSGVEWLGEVPSHWYVRKIKRIISRIESGTSVNATDVPATRNEYGVLKTSCVYSGDFDPNENKAVVAEEYTRVSCPLRSGTLIVSRMNTPDLVGAAGLVDQARAGLFLPDRLWQVHFIGADPRFVHRWTQSALYRAQVHVACSGTSASMQNLAQDQFGQFLIPYPPISEQYAISSFLERETARIDALIAEQEGLVELLKEKRQGVISHAVTKGLDPDVPTKDSGVEWLGKVPAHWAVERLGTLFREAVEEGASDLPILSVSIHDGVSDRELHEHELDRKVTRSDDRSKYKRVAPGDLVYNMMRAWQGGFGSVGIEGLVSPAYVVARPRTDLPTQFIEHVLRTPTAVEEMRRFSRGITDFRLRLYWEEFKSIKVPVPPSGDQGAIMAFLYRETAKIDSLLAEVERSIHLLLERRAVLISASVTGQFDVRGAVPQLAQPEELAT